MSQAHDITTQDYNGSLLTTQLLSGTNQTLVLSDLGPETDTTISTGANKTLKVGEAYTLDDGREVTIQGSGTAQPGVNVAGLTVPLGEEVPLVIAEDEAGETVFIYPEGTPNEADQVALVINATETDFVICFVAGTLIATPQGARPVEQLRVGDPVVTRDNGVQKIRWIGRRNLAGATLRWRPELRPIEIKAGALGHGEPGSDMMVSPNHRVLVRNHLTELYFAEREVLVAAKHLVGMAGVRIAQVPQVSYVHFLCDRHEVVLSNQAWTESFHPGDFSLKSLGAEQREEIYALFPELQQPDGLTAFVAARHSLKRFEAQLLH